jgi:integrase
MLLRAALCAVKPLVEHFGSYKIRSITYGDIRSYKQKRLQTPTRYGTQRGIAAVNKELSKLKRMFNIAWREQWLSRNPFENGESLISDGPHRSRVLSFEEEAKLFSVIEIEPKRAHLRGILMIALDCALRRGEIFTLRWSDVDLERKTITIRAFNTKTARSRTVAMTIRLNQDLQSRWLESTHVSDALVFGVSVTIKTAWKKICRAAGVQDFHFHDCRHTAITRMIRAGIAPVEVMRVSGHTTMAAFYRYVNLDSNAIFRAAAALDSLNQTSTSHTSKPYEIAC